MVKQISNVTICILFALFTISTALAEPLQYPSLAQITTYENATEKKPINKAIGFALERDGFILTVYQNLLLPKGEQLAKNIHVRIPGHDRHYVADIVGVEPTLNLAILKIFPNKPLNISRILSYEELEEGDALLVPQLFDIEQINNSDSALADGRLLKGTLVVLSERECYQENLTSTMLKSNIEDVFLKVGSPIFNEQGQIVALYTGYRPPNHEFEPSAYKSYLLPAFLANYIYDSLKHKKSMRSPWTGFSVRRLNQQELKLFPTENGEKLGIAIEEVWKGSPADKLGIKPSDILLRFGHYRIESPADFQTWLYMYGVGHTVNLLLLRGGTEYIELSYHIEERPSWAVPR